MEGERGLCEAGHRETGDIMGPMGTDRVKGTSTYPGKERDTPELELDAPLLLSSRVVLSQD